MPHETRDDLLHNHLQEPVLERLLPAQVAAAHTLTLPLLKRLRYFKQTADFSVLTRAMSRQQWLKYTGRSFNSLCCQESASAVHDSPNMDRKICCSELFWSGVRSPLEAEAGRSHRRKNLL